MALRRLPQTAQFVIPQRMPLLKKLFWAYFLLLFFEGALRKWILPQLSGPLLVVRDPVAILIIWEAYRTHKWPKAWSTATGILAVGMLALCIVQVVAGSNPWFSALYGLRSFLLPFPVAFIMGENLDFEDLRKFANWTLWLLLPLTVLEGVQYYQPADSFWNKGASEGSVQLAYAAGHVRASATFTYVTGPAYYLPLAAAFVFYGLANPKFAKKWLLWASSIALIMAIPLTGSRTVVFEMGAIVLFVGLLAFSGISQFTKAIQMIVVMLVAALVVSRLPVFADASDTLMTRFSEASGTEGTVEQSFISRVISPATMTIDQNLEAGNWLGVGIGFGSSAITQLVSGQPTFLVGEEEFPRVIGEFGWPCGVAFMLFRIILEGSLIAKAILRAREGQPLAWLLVPVTFRILVLGQLEQPTIQGFMVITFAFSMVALRMQPVGATSVQNQFPVRRPTRPRLGVS